MWALAIDPTDAATVYAGPRILSGTFPYAVYKTTDGGNSWSLASTGLPNQRTTALAVDPKSRMTVYAGIWNGGVFKSTDGGGSWNAANNGLLYWDINALVIDPSNPATLYAATSRAGVFRAQMAAHAGSLLALTRSPADRSHARVPLPYAESAPHCVDPGKYPDALHAARIRIQLVRLRRQSSEVKGRTGNGLPPGIGNQRDVSPDRRQRCHGAVE